MMENTKTMPQIGLIIDDQQAIVKMLNILLADEHLIYVKTRKAHWAVTGIQFYALHELLEQQYNDLQLQADEIAERVRMLGGDALGTMTEFMDHTRLEEEPGENPDSEELLMRLLHDHETLITNLRHDIEASTADYQDDGTADLLTALLRAHEKMAWMIRATLNQ
ncbi:MAG: DNA starvation/stationary phase protection protein [Anaerolineales bacterium]|nr:DNA starvation/stationary phase protection protein [Anaerolineales bacterium]